MNRFAVGLLVGMGGALVLTAFGQSQNEVAVPGAVPIDSQSPATCPDASTREANKRVAEAFFGPPGKPMDVNNAYSLMDPGYRQHNPVFKRFGEINHLQGRDEFKAMNSAMSRGGGAGFGPPPNGGQGAPPRGNQFYKVLADCDMVVVLHQNYLPDPQNKGGFYEAFSFDAWRVRNGKLAEHWDGATIPNMVPAFLKAPLNGPK